MDNSNLAIRILTSKRVCDLLEMFGVGGFIGGIVLISLDRSIIVAVTLIVLGLVSAAASLILDIKAGRH